jgi:hypothetical protein
MRRLLWIGPLAAITAALANLIIYWIATGPMDMSLDIVLPGSTDLQPLAVGMIILNSVIPALIATGVFALLVRFTRRPVPIFLAIATVVLLLSLGAPLSLPARVAMTTKLVLELMHVVVAGISVWMLTQLSRES